MLDGQDFVVQCKYQESVLLAHEASKSVVDWQVV